MDRLFDMLNSHNPIGKGFKSPINRSNIVRMERMMLDIIADLKQITMVNGTALNMSRRKTFLIGFETAVRSSIGIASYIFKHSPDTKYLLTYKMNQDHIETLFSKIRSKSGFNNNPDTVCFRSALKSLLVKADITSSPNANCIELEHTDRNSILMMSFSRKKQRQDDNEESEDLSIESSSFNLEIDLSKPVQDITDYIGKWHAECLVTFSHELILGAGSTLYTTD